MRKLRVATFISLDGVMQAPGGPSEDPTGGFPWGGWVAPHWDETLDGLMGEAMGQDYDLLLGRKTYEIFAAFWPFQSDEIGAVFNAIDKYVVAGADTPMTWERSHRLDGDAARAVADLKAGGDRDLLIQGSSRLIQTLMAADLIDEATTLVFPVVLGTGKRLFDPTGHGRAWTLEQTRSTAKGVIVSRYARGGDVPTGDFAGKAPSDLERARQDRMRREG